MAAVTEISGAGEARSMALKYVKASWPIMPVWGVNADGDCLCGDTDKCVGPKRHLVGEGTVVVHTDEGAEREWGEAVGERRIALKTGKASGIIVIDVPNDVEPPTALSRTSALQVATPSGGRHYYFRIPDGVVVHGADRARIGGTGMSVIGEGGYVLLPSIRRPGEHRWINNSDKSVGISEMSDDLIAMLTASKIIEIDDADAADADNPWLVEPGGGALAQRSSTELGMARTIIDTNGHLIRSVLSVSSRNSDVLVWKDGWNTGADADATMRNMMTEVINGPIKQWAVDAAEEDDKRRIDGLRRITAKIRFTRRRAFARSASSSGSVMCSNTSLETSQSYSRRKTAGSPLCATRWQWSRTSGATWPMA